MSDKSTATSGGVGLGGLLGVTFIVLKLTHVINWSWWWVLCPIWAPFALAVVIILIIGLIAVFTD